MEKAQENSKLEELKAFATDTRSFILELISEFEKLGINEKHFFTDKEFEDEDFEHPAGEFFVGISNLKGLAEAINSMENEFSSYAEDYVAHFGDIYERDSFAIQQVFSGLKAMGLTIKSDLYRYNAKVLEVAKKFGELDKKLRTLQKMAQNLKETLEKDEKNDTHNQATEESKQIRELKLTILKFKWALLFVIGISFVGTGSNIYYAAKHKTKLSLKNTELKQKLKNAKNSADHCRQLYESCAETNTRKIFEKLLKSATTKSSTEIDGPVIKSQD